MSDEGFPNRQFIDEANRQQAEFLVWNSKQDRYREERKLLHENQLHCACQSLPFVDTVTWSRIFLEDDMDELLIGADILEENGFADTAALMKMASTMFKISRGNTVVVGMAKIQSTPVQRA